MTFCHGTTLQHYRLPDVTTNVTKFVFSRNEQAFPSLNDDILTQQDGAGENYRDLLTRLSTALAMTEAAYLEARRRRDL